MVTTLDLKHIRLREGGRLRGHAWEQISLTWLARRTELLCLGNTAPIWRLLSTGKKTHVMVHDLSFLYFPKAYSLRFRLWYGVVVRLALARAKTIVTVSESEARAMAQRLPERVRPSRIVVAQNGGGEGAARAGGASGNELAKSNQPRGGEVLDGAKVLYVGSLTDRKNSKGLISIAEALARGHRISTAVVGSSGNQFGGSLPTADEDVSLQVEFLGQVNDEYALSLIYASARAFVFPSFYEASPLPPIEAMAHGVPVVCSDIPSLRERCGTAAVYVDPHDNAGFVREIAHLFEDDEHHARQRELGLVQAAVWSWERQASTVLRECLSIHSVVGD